MPVVVTRPDGTIQKGGWAVVGTPGMLLHEVLQDDNDTTWIETPVKLQTDSEIAKVSIQDFDLPDRAKIFAVRMRVRVQKIQATPGNPDPPTPRPHCGFHRHGFIFELIEFIFRILFGFRCPRKPPPPSPSTPPEPPEWTTVDLAYYPEQPGGGEWTEQTFDDFFASLARSDDEAAVLRISSIFVDLDYNEAPVVEVTGPIGPLIDITLPTVTWEYMDAESDQQEAFWVRIFTEDVYNLPSFDPESEDFIAFAQTDGWVLGSDNFWTLNRDCPNGTYRAYVKVRQLWPGIGLHSSEWDYWQWTQAVPGPPQPTLTANFEMDLNRVRIDLHEGGPSPETDTYNIEYSDDLAISWHLLRNGYRVDIDDQRDSLVYDYEAPLHQVRMYRGAAFRVLNGIPVTSGFSNQASVYPEIDGWWLKDVLVPEANCRVVVTDMTRTEPRSRGVHRPMIADETGRALAVVITGARGGAEGELHFAFVPNRETGQEEDFDNFNIVYRPGRTLLLQAPNHEQWYVSLGDIKYDKWKMKADGTRYRLIIVPYIETYKPPDLTAIAVKRR